MCGSFQEPRRSSASRVLPAKPNSIKPRSGGGDGGGYVETPLTFLHSIVIF